MSLDLNTRLSSSTSYSPVVSDTPSFSLGGLGARDGVLLAFAPTGTELEIARQALERAFSLPAFTPPPTPVGLGARAANLVGNIARLGLAFVAGRYLTSEGELNLAKDTGQIGRNVTMDDMRNASSAMERVGMTGQGLGQGWSADQRTRFIMGAAELNRLRDAGRIGDATLRQAMDELVAGVQSPSARPAPVAAPAPTAPASSAVNTGQVHGPADAAGIANWRRQVENDAAARTRALDAASRANPVPALPGVRTPDVGPYDWNQVGDVARQFNANSPDRLEVAVRVPVDRNYGGELGSRREVGLLVGSPFALADQVAAMQRNGQIPRDFDLAGAARQAGVDWNGAVQAEANLRAQRVAAENPITLAGNRTYLAADRADAVAAAQNFNRGSSGADLIAVPVAVNRTVSSGATSATGVSHEVWVGSPDQLSNFYETLSGQGRLAGNPSYADLQRDAGISGSFPGRVAAARDLRAAQREIADPTTLFGSTVGVQASAGAAQREVLAFNRNPVPADHLQLYVPLTRDVSGPGLPANARGTAHAVYQGPAENLRGFYDEMNRQGRIPQGVSFDQLLQQSGIQGTYRERIAQAQGQGAEQSPPVPDTFRKVEEEIERFRALPRVPGESEEARRRRFLESIEDPTVRSFVEEAIRPLGEGLIGGPTGTSQARVDGAGAGTPPDGGAVAAAGADEPGGPPTQESFSAEAARIFGQADLAAISRRVDPDLLAMLDDPQGAIAGFTPDQSAAMRRVLSEQLPDLQTPDDIARFITQMFVNPVSGLKNAHALPLVAEPGHHLIVAEFGGGKAVNELLSHQHGDDLIAAGMAEIARVVESEGGQVLHPNGATAIIVVPPDRVEETLRRLDAAFSDLMIGTGELGPGRQVFRPGIAWLDTGPIMDTSVDALESQFARGRAGIDAVKAERVEQGLYPARGADLFGPYIPGVHQRVRPLEGTASVPPTGARQDQNAVLRDRFEALRDQIADMSPADRQTLAQRAVQERFMHGPGILNGAAELTAPRDPDGRVPEGFVHAQGDLSRLSVINGFSWDAGDAAIGHLNAAMEAAAAAYPNVTFQKYGGDEWEAIGPRADVEAATTMIREYLAGVTVAFPNPRNPAETLTLHGLGVQIGILDIAPDSRSGRASSEALEHEMGADKARRNYQLDIRDADGNPYRP